MFNEIRIYYKVFIFRTSIANRDISSISTNIQNSMKKLDKLRDLDNRENNSDTGTQSNIDDDGKKTQDICNLQTEISEKELAVSDLTEKMKQSKSY